MEALKRLLHRGPQIVPSPTEDMELCEIVVSEDGSFYMKPSEEAKIQVNGCNVNGRIPLFHEDQIQLEEERIWFVLNLPDRRRTSSHSCPQTIFKNSCGHLNFSNQDSHIILLSSQAGLEEDLTEKLSKASSHYNIHGSTSKLGLCPSGQVTYRPQMTSPRCNSERKVGVFFWDAATDITWVVDHLMSKTPSSVSCLALFQASDQLWKSVASRCSVIIFCLSMKSKKSLYDMEVYLEHCLQSHGPEKITVVITDLEDTMSEKGMRAQWRQSQLSGCDLLLFTEKDMNLLLRQRVMAERRNMEAKLNQIKCILLQQLSGKTHS
ncbi:hypothetical protein GDO81_026278 [Engystomops pustulosus]|uniref:Uncharacterized protein n=1 Tax=Engystomops pustulosus TaxID=76066 RepID=A0AAV6YHI4_ENGPU|nr:hypothetical protein GDO81_026278 [Engystomops pustulosus]